jgi:hypothetical protein
MTLTSEFYRNVSWIHVGTSDLSPWKILQSGAGLTVALTPSSIVIFQQFIWERQIKHLGQFVQYGVCLLMTLTPSSIVMFQQFIWERQIRHLGQFVQFGVCLLMALKYEFYRNVSWIHMGTSNLSAWKILQSGAGLTVALTPSSIVMFYEFMWERQIRHLGQFVQFGAGPTVALNSKFHRNGS